MEKYSVLKTLRQMVGRAFRENKRIFVYFIIYTMFGGIYPVFGVLLPKFTLEELSGEGRPERLLLIITVYFLAAGVVGAVTAAMAHLAYEAISRLRLDALGEMGKKLLEMDYRYVEDAKFYEENERAMNACNSNENGLEGIYHKLYGMLADVAAMGIFLVLIGRLDIWILAALLAHVAVSAMVGRKAQEYEYSMKDKLAHQKRKEEYYARIAHDFSYGKDIRIYNFRDRILDNYNREINGYRILLRKIKTREWLLGLAELFFFFISQAAVYGILIYRAFHGMSIADFTMYYSAASSLSQMMLLFGEKVNYVIKEGQYVHDFYLFMEKDLSGSKGTRERIKNGTLEIEFKDVGFSYPKTEKQVFQHLNFTIHKGEKLAVVGVNGAGKSTLVKLMTGLYQPTEGEILINGIPAWEFDKRELYKMFSVVFQEINVLAYTVKENVSCVSGEADTERVWEALEGAGLAEKIKSFEKGLDQMLLKVIDEKGTELSGGQSQKLCIARALYENSNMVIMDEPTAALDALAEAEIYETFNRLVGEKTAVYISHRLASTKFCDKIALFDKEGLQEYGSHEELMAKKGIYYKMFVTQGKYYNMSGKEEEACG